MPQLTDDLLKVYGPPTAPDQDFFLDQVDRVVGRATEATQRRSIEILLESRKSPRWPTVGEISDALATAAAEQPKTYVPPTPKPSKLIILTPVDIQWDNWMAYLADWEMHAEIEAAKDRGELHVNQRWPSTSARVLWPKCDRPNTLEEVRRINARMLGEATE